MAVPVVGGAGGIAGVLRAAGVARRDPVAVVVVPGTGVALATARGGWAVRATAEAAAADPAAAAVAEVVSEIERELAPRWVWWSAHGTAAGLVAAGVRPAACWDLSAVHRVLHGGRRDEPGAVWAAARGLPLPPVGPPARQDGQLDLLSDGPDGPDDPDGPDGPDGPDEHAAGRAVSMLLGRDGQLRSGWAREAPGGRRDAAGDSVVGRLERAAEFARLALLVFESQDAALRRLADPRARPTGVPLAVLTARAESAAELLACELEHDGLPLDRTVAETTVAGLVGARPHGDAEEAAARRQRDAPVLAHLGDGVDLRNPVALRAALARLGIDVPDTRAARLTALRAVHPVVPALLEWRKAERVATTYGYRWLDRHVGADGRLRGAWRGSDGAGGRMTAAAGLHNLPAVLRVAVVAEPGHRLVRADLGQVEPRVLAAVSGDRAFALATRRDDLYAPVAATLGSDRPTAKIAVLAAMYGQTSGAAGVALRQLRQAYPTALAYLDAAETAGRAGQDVRTFGGRHLPTDIFSAEGDRVVLARGRYARNAVVQGAAAELFKAWAATVRQQLVGLGGTIVLCLHDELLLQVPTDQAEAAARLTHEALERTAAYWAAGSGVRFVADVRVVDRWTDAKS